eukprot:6239314-Amphidinium_carterae.1
MDFVDCDALCHILNSPSRHTSSLCDNQLCWCARFGLQNASADRSCDDDDSTKYTIAAVMKIMDKH